VVHKNSSLAEMLLAHAAGRAFRENYQILGDIGTPIFAGLAGMQCENP
jgi:hypothetical protein